MHKFFVTEEAIEDNRAVIEGDDVKHIYKVLRLKAGDEVLINNCKGTEYRGIIGSVNKKEVEVELTEKIEMNNESAVEVYLYQGFPKATKMDLIAQKCTELGIKEIIPVATERVVVKLDGKNTKTDRWNRIALEACKQSKRSIIPQVKEVIEFRDTLEELKNMDLVVVPYENAENYGFKKLFSEVDKDSIKRIGIVIGPEGGFEESEIEELKNIGGKIVTLGPRILRTETAGFTALSVIMYELGDLGGNL